MEGLGTTKNIHLDLPITVVLTEQGADFFVSNNRRLQRIRTADNDEARGMLLQSISLPSLQQMIAFDYVSKVEVSREEFSSKRQALIDLNKLIVYGVLYKQFDQAVFGEMAESDLVKRRNRKNRGDLINEDSRMSGSRLRGFLAENGPKVTEMKAGLLAEVRHRLTGDEKLGEEDLRLYYLTAEKLLDRLRPLVWLLLIEGDDSETGRIVGRILDLLMRHVERSRIAEYSALLLLELVSNAENTNLEGYVKSAYRGTVEPARVYHDAALRQRVLRELRSAEEWLFVGWRIRGSASSIGTERKLQVTIYNRSGEYYALRDSINSKKNLDASKKSLKEFYEAFPESIANRELGLYYITYLNDECRRQEVHFESNVSYMPSTGYTVTALNLTF